MKRNKEIQIVCDTMQEFGFMETEELRAAIKEGLKRVRAGKFAEARARKERVQGKII